MNGWRRPTSDCQRSSRSRRRLMRVGISQLPMPERTCTMLRMTLGALAFAAASLALVPGAGAVPVAAGDMPSTGKSLVIDVRQGGGGGGRGFSGGGGGFSGKSFSGGVRSGPRGGGFSGPRLHAGKGGHHHHGRRPRGGIYYSVPSYYYYSSPGYYYGGECGWLLRKARRTGSSYWWNRYYDCIE